MNSFSEMREKAQKLEETQSEQVLKRPMSRFGVGEAAASNLLSTWAREEQEEQKAQK